ncbi:hypothetical protein MTR67_027626 [Solanum verrucosum]|uniref:Uncharacterized protein n=1 Tax=Solanum verrucosum TaxID=315347 RepID=A0AAF0R9I3_SOLVR|nr:hypothetical protein MTR67_027626 [Solanum verrucosum]
MIQRGGSNT